MNNLSDYRSLTEVTTGADFNESRMIMKDLRTLLNIGWELIAVHERGWKSDTTRYTTVYILGHKQPNAPLSSDEIPF